MTSGSSLEISAPESFTRERALDRLYDWQRRVHRLFDDIEYALRDTDLRIDRSGKHQAREKVAQRMGLADNDAPQVDILRIERSDGSLAATLVPRALWIVGANGLVDLKLAGAGRPAELYLLIDQSEPLSGGAKWIRSPIAAPFEREPFDPSWLRAKLA